MGLQTSCLQTSDSSDPSSAAFGPTTLDPAARPACARRFSAKPTVLRTDAMEAYFTSLRDRQPIGVKGLAAGGGGGGVQVRAWRASRLGAIARRAPALLERLCDGRLRRCTGRAPPLLPPFDVTRRRRHQVTIMTDDMDLAGDLVQDLVADLGVSELASRANFPTAMEAFQQTLAQVQAESGSCGHRG